MNNTVVKTNHYRAHSIPSYGEHKAHMLSEDSIVYGLIFASTAKCKVEALTSTPNGEVTLMSAYNTQANQTLTLNFPGPVMVSTSTYIRITNLDTQAADANITIFYNDPYAAFSDQFGRDLEETLSR